uniref:Uncharacterized protein n=1 Tax=Moniliophthora roreri TaxID=221103 RepID=A0A0W0F5J4_MONRR
MADSATGTCSDGDGDKKEMMTISIEQEVLD